MNIRSGRSIGGIIRFRRFIFILINFPSTLYLYCVCPFEIFCNKYRLVGLRFNNKKELYPGFIVINFRSTVWYSYNKICNYWKISTYRQSRFDLHRIFHIYIIRYIEYISNNHSINDLLPMLFIYILYFFDFSSNISWEKFKISSDKHH